MDFVLCEIMTFAILPIFEKAKLQLLGTFDPQKWPKLDFSYIKK